MSKRVSKMRPRILLTGGVDALAREEIFRGVEDPGRCTRRGTGVGCHEGGVLTASRE